MSLIKKPKPNCYTLSTVRPFSCVLGPRTIKQILKALVQLRRHPKSPGHSLFLYALEYPFPYASHFCSLHVTFPTIIFIYVPLPLPRLPPLPYLTFLKLLLLIRLLKPPMPPPLLLEALLLLRSTLPPLLPPKPPARYMANRDKKRNSRIILFISSFLVQGYL